MDFYEKMKFISIHMIYSVSKTTRSKVSKNRNQRKLIAAVAAKTNMHFFLLTIPMNKRISTTSRSRSIQGSNNIEKDN